MKVERLIEIVLLEMEGRNYARSTVETLRRQYKPMIRWFDERNDGNYDLDAHESYLRKYEKMLNDHLVTANHLQTIRRALNYIREVAETGNAKLSRQKPERQYQESAEAAHTINAALALSKMTDGDKQKSRILLSKFFCYIENKGLYVYDITVEVLIEFIHHVRTSNAGSMKKVIRALKAMADYLASVGIMAPLPDISFLTPRISRKIISAYTVEEATTILSSFDRDTPLGKRNYAMILLALGTGLRGCDIVNLKLSDINWESKEIRLIQSKTKKPLTVQLSGQLCNAIADYILDERPQSELKNVFLSSRAPFAPISTSALVRIIDTVHRKTDLSRKYWRSFHSMRRSFGTWLAKEAVPAATISQMLGQVKIDSSRSYISFDDTQISACAIGFDDIPLRGGAYV